MQVLLQWIIAVFSTVIWSEIFSWASSLVRLGYAWAVVMRYDFCCGTAHFLCNPPSLVYTTSLPTNTNKIHAGKVYQVRPCLTLQTKTTFLANRSDSFWLCDTEEGWG